MPNHHLPMRKRLPVWTFGAALPSLASAHAQAKVPKPDARPDWVQCDPAWIAAALAKSQAKPSGGWYVAAASSEVTTRPKALAIGGVPLVAWRTPGHGDSHGRVHIAPEHCPHLGASLVAASIEGDCLVCPWHGLRLGPKGRRDWMPLPAFDDGVLVWARMDNGTPAADLTERPFLPARPAHFIDAVITMPAACEPQDVIANRLDPWHGVHYHGHSFGRLSVIDQQDDEITVRVAYRVLGPLAVEVDARFYCTDPRTIVMSIIAGEGKGSVVETHATQIGPGRTHIIEATLATSERPGFRVASLAKGLIRPLMGLAARRLWVEDAAYAEAIFARRQRQLP